MREEEEEEDVVVAVVDREGDRVRTRGRGSGWCETRLSRATYCASAAFA